MEKDNELLSRNYYKKAPFAWLTYSHVDALVAVLVEVLDGLKQDEKVDSSKSILFSFIHACRRHILLYPSIPAGWMCLVVSYSITFIMDSPISTQFAAWSGVGSGHPAHITGFNNSAIYPFNQWCRSGSGFIWVCGSGSTDIKSLIKWREKQRLTNKNLFLCSKLYFSSLNLKKVGADVCWRPPPHSTHIFLLL